MFAYVDELYPKPDTLQHSFYYDSRVDVCVRLFWNATLNLFGQSETVWDKDLVLAHRPPNNLCSRIPFLLYFLPSFNNPPIYFGGPIPLSKVNQGHIL